MSALSDVIEIDKILGRLTFFYQSPNIDLPLELMEPNPSRSTQTTCFGIGFHRGVRKGMTRLSRGHSKVKPAQNG